MKMSSYWGFLSMKGSNATEVERVRKKVLYHFGNTCRAFVPRMHTVNSIFRKIFKTKIHIRFSLKRTDGREIRIADAGDISNATSLEVGHSELKSRVASILKTGIRFFHLILFLLMDGGAVPFVVGGGNDQSYPNASALLGYSQ